MARATKAEEVGGFVRHKVRAALADTALYEDPEFRAAILKYHTVIARAVAEEVVSEYSMLELSDIMEWKRTRVRR